MADQKIVSEAALTAIASDIKQAIAGKADAYVELTGTLTAGQTSITLSDVAITGSSTIDVYTDYFGISPTDVVVATGSVTLTFETQGADLGVKVRVS